MEEINIDNKICILLNHQKQIEYLYQQHVAANTNCYSLKKQIFNFKPKNDIQSSEAISNSQQLKYHNRKRKAETENASTVNENLLLQLFITEIKKKLSNLPESNEHLLRFWEEHHEFPQFRGANLTNEYQITKFSQKDYVIPPKTKFFNYNVQCLSELLPDLETYDLLIMDMPWRNKYIKRLKKVKTSLAYQMIDNETLKNMPISQLIHTNSLVAMWCTNSKQHRKSIEDEFLPKWNLQLVHILKWFKINTSGELISPLKPDGCKQPYELLYITCNKQRHLLDLQQLTTVDFLISIPSIIHSHKPPLVDWLKKFLPNGDSFKGLEIFARYLQPQFTSIGLEVLKLMDKRLYNVTQERSLR